VNILFGLKIGELLLILVVVVFIFGPKRIGSLTRSLGRTFFQYKKTVNDIKSDLTLDPAEKKDPENKV